MVCPLEARQLPLLSIANFATSSTMSSHRVRHPKLYDICPCPVQREKSLFGGVHVGVACYYKGYESPPAAAMASCMLPGAFPRMYGITRCGAII